MQRESVLQGIIKERKQTVDNSIMGLEDSGLLWLKDVDSINTEVGLNNCGDWDSYISALKIFYTTYEDKISEIKEQYEQEDWETYAVRMHGMKSAARVIGAEDLFEKARLLEMAGKEKDVSFIRNRIDGFLEDYKRLGEQLASLEKNEKELPPVSEDMLQDAYQTLLEAVDAEDSDLCEIVLMEMKNYTLPERDKPIFRELYKKYLSVDWEGMRDLICQER